MKDFEFLEKVKKDFSTRDIPIIIFSQLERKENRKKAMQMEAKDFIAAASVTPAKLLRKVKIILGEQKSYRIKISSNSDDIKGLMRDLDYTNPNLKCPKCSSDLKLSLIRDLSIGNNHFIISFVCPDCE